ncbi:MAG: carbohydrate kinase family protein [Methylococcaceae bacterium]
MKSSPIDVDVLCVGHASYDLVFEVSHHPGEDEKVSAQGFVACGGGPAANAAVAISRLGFKAAFAGYLGADIYGEKHLQELIESNVYTGLIISGSSPTPISTVLVKPDGKRALINYKGDTQPLPSGAIDFSRIRPKVALFDGHEAHLSTPVCKDFRSKGIATVLDAGSLHNGTLSLLGEVDYLACSEKFAEQFAGNEEAALNLLANISPAVIITLGERGLIWRRGAEQGVLTAYPVQAVDTTGAGDAFHGAFAAAISSGMAWLDVLRYASAAGSLCCAKMGARQGLPWKEEHQALLSSSA